MNQGKRLTEREIGRIRRLLETTELTLTAIGERMGCSKNSVVTVNRRFQIREYRDWNHWRLVKA